MSMQDPLSDMLTRIRNAQMAGKTSVDMPGSKLKAALEEGGEHHRAAMALKLYDVLSRKGMGAGKVDHEAFVERFPSAIAQARVVRIAGRQAAPARQF